MNLRARPLLFSIIVIISVAALIGAVFLHIRAVTESKKALFRENVHQNLLRTKVLIDDRMTLYINGLYAVRSAFALSDGLTRKEFEQYTQQLDILRTYPGLSAFGFVQRVPHTEIGAFVSSVRKDSSTVPGGYPDFHIYPESKETEHFILTYFEPSEGTTSSLGFDFSSDPRRMDALSAARDSGQPVLTTRVSGISKQLSALLISLPVYRSEEKNLTVSTRRSAFIGVLNAGLRVNELFASLFPLRISKTERVEIFDGTDLTEEQLLYDSNPSLNKDGKSLSETLTTTVASRVWTIRYSKLDR